MNRYLLIAVLWVGIIMSGIAQESAKSKIEQSFELEVQGEYRYFFDEGLFDGQSQHFPSISLRPKYNLEWNDGDERLNFEGFLRLDRDASRTHWDIRELYYQKVNASWELSAGLKKVFWGVTESAHLVDIINQTDQVESFDGEEKLGQPMVQFAWTNHKIGTFEFYYLPFHRRRTFAGEQGRFRFPQVIENDELGYESGANKWRQDFAVRWKHYFGPVDIGLSHFYGTDREPMFTFSQEGEVNAFYPVIHQSGVDLQVTHGAFLWKFESIYKTSSYQDVFAFVGGLEYTFGNVNGKGLDIGLIGEYLFDDRDEWALSALQNDLFVGSRLGFNDMNDTSILLGGIFDLENSSKIFAIEASRRIGSNFTMELEARIFSNIDQDELLLSNFQNDSFLKISLSKYF